MSAAATESWAVVAGGGTAGHVLPGVAIAQALHARGHSVHYVGAARGIEARLLPELGLAHTLLPGRGIQRRVSLQNVGAVIGILRAVVAAFGLLRRLRPHVVVALGGYASVPCVLAAVVRRVPIVVAEQNIVPGVANRLAARFAAVSAVTFEGTPLPRAVVTGNPIRAEIVAARDSDRAAAREALGVEPGRTLVLVAGGSLGALSINEATLDLVGRWRDRSDLAVRHVVGERDWDPISAAAPELPEGGIAYVQVRYEHDMARALRAADLGVFRSGSSTCNELAVLGLPSVLVPSPHVTGGHQAGNARHLAATGGAVVVPDAELDGARLAAELDALVADPARRAAMAEALAPLARPDAADRVADLVEAHAR